MGNVVVPCNGVKRPGIYLGLKQLDSGASFLDLRSTLQDVFQRSPDFFAATDQGAGTLPRGQAEIYRQVSQYYNTGAASCDLTAETKKFRGFLNNFTSTRVHSTGVKSFKPSKQLRVSCVTKIVNIFIAQIK